MAKVFLNNESFTLSSSAQVYGGSGTEIVKIASNAAAVEFDSKCERVEVVSNLADYTYQVEGNLLYVYYGTGAGMVKVASIALEGNPFKIWFADGSAEVAITGMNAVTLGGVAVPTVQGAVAGATINTSEKSTVAGGGGTVVGQSYTLTTGTDIFTLTAGNDTVTGAAGTLATGDMMLDPSTTDTDTATIVVTAAAKPLMTNIENPTFNFALGSGALDAATVSGTKLVTIGSAEAGSVTAVVNNVKTGQTFDIQTSAIQNLTIDSVGTTSDNAETATLNLKGTAGTTGLTLTLDATGAAAATDIDILTLNSTTASNTVTMATVGAVYAATGEKIVATGNKNLTLKTGATAASNGFAGATVENTLTDGATLTVEYTGALDSAHDLSKVAANKFVFSGAPTANADVTVASGATVQLKGDFTALGSNPIQSKTDGGTLNLSATVGQSANTLNLTKFSTVNLSVTDSVTYNNLTLDNAATLNDAKLNITGTDSTKTLTLTSVTAKVIDASTVVGKLVITNAKANADITLGTNDDKITVGNVAGVKVTTTSGNDEITTSGANAITLVGGTGNDTLKVADPTHFLGTLDGGTGSNTITFTSAAAHDVSGNAVTFTNFSLIDVTATNGASTFSAAQLATKSLNIIGGGANDSVVVNHATGASATAVLIDMSNINHSGLTSMTLGGSGEADIIKDSKGVDVIIGGAAADSISLAAGGSDMVQVSDVTAGGIDTVTSLICGDTATVAGADAIRVDAGATATLAVNDWRTTKVFTKGSGAGEYAALTNVLATFAAGQANATTAKNTYVFTFDSKVYALIDDTTNGYAAGDDAVVEITGFSGTLHTTNFLTA